MSIFFRCLVALLLSSSCGYRWSSEGGQVSVAVPFVHGDVDGALTAELIYTLSTSPRVWVVSEREEYSLEVKIVSQNYETIGYRMDPQQTDGKTQKNITGDEGRRTFVAEVSLIRKEDGVVLFGPAEIRVDVDYDYVDGDSYRDLTFVDATGNTQTVLAFSLGQLESVEAAQEASLRSLYRKLSRKIVDCISAQW